MLPIGRLVVVMDAVPLLIVAVPKVVEPVVKVTEPVASLGTVAVIVTVERYVL